MSLKDIKNFIYMTMKGDETIEDRLNLFKKQREIVEKQMEELKNTLETVKFKCWYYETAKKSGTTEAIKNMNYENIPDEYKAVWKKIVGQ